jgi:hypothetical protein
LTGTFALLSSRLPGGSVASEAEMANFIMNKKDKPEKFFEYVLKEAVRTGEFQTVTDTTGRQVKVEPTDTLEGLVEKHDAIKAW